MYFLSVSYESSKEWHWNSEEPTKHPLPGLWVTFLAKNNLWELEKWPIDIWKDAELQNHQVNVNWKPNEIPITKSEWLLSKSQERVCWWGCRERGTLVHCWWDWKFVQPPWKTVWRFLKKLNIDIPYNPGTSLLGIYPKKTKTLIWEDICTLYVDCTTIYNSQ